MAHLGAPDDVVARGMLEVLPLTRSERSAVAALVTDLLERQDV